MSARVTDFISQDTQARTSPEKVISQIDPIGIRTRDLQIRCPQHKSFDHLDRQNFILNLYLFLFNFPLNGPPLIHTKLYRPNRHAIIFTVYCVCLSAATCVSVSVCIVPVKVVKPTCLYVPQSSTAVYQYEGQADSA